MEDKRYPSEVEELICGRNTGHIQYRITGRTPSVRILLGPGMFGNISDDDLFGYLSQSAADESIDIVRFSYPANLSRRWWHPDIGARRRIMRCALARVLAQTDENVPIFIGGKSLSALLASEIRDPRIGGYIFFSFPLRLPGMPFPLPAKRQKKLHKPMLFIQGAQDPLSPKKALETRIRRLNPHAYLMLLPDAGHALDPVEGAQRSRDEIHSEISNVIFWFISDVLHKQKLN